MFEIGRAKPSWSKKIDLYSISEKVSMSMLIIVGLSNEADQLCVSSEEELFVFMLLNSIEDSPELTTCARGASRSKDIICKHSGFVILV